MRPHRSVAVPLAWVYALLLAYASLYPFEGWQWPAGAVVSELVRLPWPPWRSRFDEWSNFLGYAPLGLVLFVALQARFRSFGIWAVLCSGLLGSTLSYALEVIQHFIPGRFPSLRDWSNNTVGALAGALVAWALHGLGWLRVGERWRERWFRPHSSAALILLALWPVGLLFPTPFPLGLGHAGWLDGLRDAARELAAWASVWVEPGPWWTWDADASRPSGAVQREAWVLATGLAAPCLLAGVVTRAGWRRWLLAPATAVLALIVMTLSTALNFGPDHAWAWMTRLHLQALLAAVLVCAALCVLGPRWCAAFAGMALVVQVVLLADVPLDPYYAATLQGWEQGRFIRFHGLAQVIGWVWPYAVLAWLIAWWSASSGRRRW
jgi:VanZ family protein